MTKTLIDVDDDLREVLEAQQRREAVADLASWTARHEPLDRDARLQAWRQSP